MSIEPDDFLIWANKQPRQTETDLRCIVSRAYYGAYHRCLVFAKTFGLNLDNPHRGVHQRLIDALRQHRDTRLRSIGRELRALRDLRSRADYRLEESIGKSEADNALCKAMYLTGKVKAL